MMRAILTLFCLLLLISPLQARDFTPYHDANKRDPYWPLLGPNGNLLSYDENLSTNDMVLEGVLEGKGGIGKNVAVINGDMVEEGQTIGPYTIVAIGSSSVIMEREEEMFTLSLPIEEE